MPMSYGGHVFAAWSPNLATAVIRINELGCAHILLHVVVAVPPGVWLIFKDDSEIRKKWQERFPGWDPFAANPYDEKLQKRPVAWRVKDYANGWVLFQDEEAAHRLSDDTCALIQGLYVRDGTSAP